MTRCNMCGKVFDELDAINNFGIFSRPGYGSGHDGEVIHMNLCVDCFDQLVDSCTVSPVCEPSDEYVL